MIVATRWMRDAVDALASGVFSTPDETPGRTAKSCGPGAATLALSFAGSFPQVTVAKEPLTGESTK